MSVTAIFINEEECLKYFRNELVKYLKESFNEDNLKEDDDLEKLLKELEEKYANITNTENTKSAIFYVDQFANDVHSETFGVNLYLPLEDA